LLSEGQKISHSSVKLNHERCFFEYNKESDKVHYLKVLDFT